MNIHKNSLPARLFYASQGIWDEFSEGYGLNRHSEKTNLCHMFHVFFFAALALAVNALAVVGSAYVILLLPAKFWGVKFWGGTIAGIAIVVLAIVGFTVMCKSIAKSRRAKRQESVRKPYTPKPEKGPGMVSLAASWVVSKKKRLCPIVEFVDGSKETPNVA